MQQTMENFICLNNTIITILTTLLLTGCTPREPKLDLQLKTQPTEQVFSFANYCEGHFDSIYIIHPYDDEKVIWSLPYKMSKRLREKCSYTLDDTYARILFINNGTVKAYSEIEAKYASFSFIKFPNNKPILYFKQDLILDKDRYVHIYKE